MTEPSMSAEVRKEYEAVLAAIVLERGALVGVGKEDSNFSWEDYSNYDLTYQPHWHSCKVTHGAASESRWTEFDGTFADPPYASHHGIDLSGVTCACGMLTNRTLRLREPVQTLIPEIFSLLYHRLKKETSDDDDA